MTSAVVTVALCGDVMLGRGVDQILPHPGDPALREPALRDARAYVELAEQVNGPIERPVPFDWPWGVARPLLEHADVEARVLNLETSVTTSGDFDPSKSVHYRMHPDNLPSLEAVRPDVCALANNHVLDFGRAGLAQTLASLQAAGLRVAGAGHDLDEARTVAVVPLPGGGRLLVVSCAMTSSGVPGHWAAGADRPGVDLAPEPSTATARRLIERIDALREPGDRVVASVHWGSNWGHSIPRDQVRFAHTLVEGGVDVVHGHSSHHPRPVEVYRGRLVLYGCGDLINDYEGIRGYAEYRDDLRLLYLASLRRDTGELVGLRMAPLQARRLRLEHAAEDDAAWMAETLQRTSGRFGTRLRRDDEGWLMIYGSDHPT